MKNTEITLALLLALIIASTAFADDFRLNKDGIGPIMVSIKIDAKGSDAELNASARNESGQLITSAKLCVQIDSRAKGCDYELKTTAPWKAGEEWAWNPLKAHARRAISSPIVIITELTTASSLPNQKPGTTLPNQKSGHAHSAFIINNGTIVRESPDVKSPGVEGMVRNEKIEVLEHDADGWAKIRTLSFQRIGYLRQSEFSVKMQPAINAAQTQQPSKPEKQILWVTAVTHDSNLVTNTSTYQTPGRATTTCLDTYNTLNCNTIYTAPQQNDITISRLDVVDKVKADNGLIYTITCSANWVGSNCGPLIDGDRFSAEVEKTTMWISARRGGNQGKNVRIKYNILDIR
jgi:hypothetical protein